jgi:N-methylhydantoinase A
MDAPLRLAVDTGGTFTDLVVEGDPRGLRFFKRATTPEDPIEGLLDVLAAAGEGFGCSHRELLAQADLFVFGTTRATNAVVTGSAARTAFLTTQGHPDVLLLREGGGRTSLFDYAQEYPDPYVPRSLTFEVPERVLSDGSVQLPLDESALEEIARRLREARIEAVGVCLLWSIVNPEHELHVGRLLERHLPGVPYTLSHQLNPCLREYRRASSTVIDASLKPLMSSFFRDIEFRLRAEGFAGRLLVVTSSGGVLDAHAVAKTPIHSIGSGPAAAPVAGRRFAQTETGNSTALVTDAGGTTYDVSLVRNGKIPWTRETIVGHPIYGFQTGFPSVDVKSVGAGGGSVAWVDAGGLLHVGPRSAGANPGPACYGRGGQETTVTDACVVLGYIDPEFFLGGEMLLDRERARAVVGRDVAEPLQLSLDEAAHAVLNLAVERMVSAIEGITLKQGIDPTTATMIGGGGGAGLYSIGIARRLRSATAVIPPVSAALSATGALLSDLRSDVAETSTMSTAAWDVDVARATLGRVRREAEQFLAIAGNGVLSSDITFSVEARYPHQVWEIEVPLRSDRLESAEDVEEFRQDFQDAHEEMFAVRDDRSPVEVVSWRAHARCSLRDVTLAGARSPGPALAQDRARSAYFPQSGRVDVPVHQLDGLAVGQRLPGPLIVESTTTTIIVDPDAACEATPSGSVILYP